MKTRRTIVWTLALLFGAISAIGTILLFGTTLERFTLVNAMLIFLGMGSITFIWLDWVLRTKLLQS